MASRTTLNAANLETLGAKRLADLLIEISTGDAAAKRRLRLELAHQASPQSAAHEIRKRLTAIGNARAHVGWRRRKSVLADLEGQRRAIVETIGTSDPGEALDLFWRYMALANGVFDRTHDGSGTVAAQFEKALGDLAALAIRVAPPPDALAGQIFTALTENTYGQYDDLIAQLAPALGTTGLADLKRRLREWGTEADPEPKAAMDRRVIGHVLERNGPRALYQDDIEARRKRRTIDQALRAIADVEGDIDAFIAQHTELERTIPKVAAEIAERLLEAGRPVEALAALDNVLEEAREILADCVEEEWEAAYLATLDALGRTEEAQTFRWQCFEERLDGRRLKQYIERLPDFDDVVAEDKALNSVLEADEPLDALAFLVEWPDLKRAATCVLDPARKWNGDAYEILTPASESLAPSHPLAATRLLRAMISFSLDRGKSSRYRHAARHLDACDRLSVQIDDFAPLDTHAEFVERLRRDHGRKRGFWNRVESDVIAPATPGF